MSTPQFSFAHDSANKSHPIALRRWGALDTRLSVDHALRLLNELAGAVAAEQAADPTAVHLRVVPVAPEVGE